MFKCQQCGLTDILHNLCTCLRCGIRHSKSRGCRVRSIPVIFGAGCCWDSIVLPHSILSMSIVCVHCAARWWPGEVMNCCDHGLIVLPMFPIVPTDLADVIYTPHVKTNIRAYNTAMCMASIGHESKGLIFGAFVLGGRTYHRMATGYRPAAFFCTNLYVRCRCCHRSPVGRVRR